MHVYTSDTSYFFETLERLQLNAILSRGINQQRASAYLPDAVSIYENGDAIRSRLIFLTGAWLKPGSCSLNLDTSFRVIHPSPSRHPRARISITYLYNSHGSVNPTFQDLPSASLASSTLCDHPRLPSRQNSAVSPFHAPYTVSPILINFTNPDGKSGL